MAKFHIKNNGDAAICKAIKGNCPFGKDEEHYDSASAARESFERSQAGSFAAPAPTGKAPTVSLTTARRKAAIETIDGVAKELDRLDRLEERRMRGDDSVSQKIVDSWISINEKYFEELKAIAASDDFVENSYDENYRTYRAAFSKQFDRIGGSSASDIAWKLRQGKRILTKAQRAEDRKAAAKSLQESGEGVSGHETYKEILKKNKTLKASMDEFFSDPKLVEKFINESPNISSAVKTISPYGSGISRRLKETITQHNISWPAHWPAPRG